MATYKLTATYDEQHTDEALFCVDHARPERPVSVSWDEGETWQGTPFQSVDFQRPERSAGALVEDADDDTRIEVERLPDAEDAESLDELLATVTRPDMLHADLDPHTLPKFGGDEPDDTAGVWSWDDDRLLCNDGDACGWYIAPREDQPAEMDESAYARVQELLSNG